MCILCEGTSEHDLFDGFRDRVDEFGFTMISVGDESGSWTYTIGLLANFGHPEFVATGLSPAAASSVFTALVERIRKGETFTSSSDDSTHEGIPVRFGDVHRSQWTHGRFAMWGAYYDRFGGRPLSPSATQVLWANEDGVFPPDRDFCHQHRNCQPLLAFAVNRDVNLAGRRDRPASKRRKNRR